METSGCQETAVWERIIAFNSARRWRLDSSVKHSFSVDVVSNRLLPSTCRHDSWLTCLRRGG